MARKTAADRQAEHEAKLTAALSWPKRPRPEPVPGAEIAAATECGGVFRGWSPLGRFGLGTNFDARPGGVVGAACFLGEHTDDEIRDRFNPERRRSVHMSQGRGGPWFRTEAEALTEAHWRLCEQAASTLYAVALAIKEAERTC